jgi:FkbM family methyltransferase
MPSFVLNGVTLDLPDFALSAPLIAALDSGRYEHTEAGALAKHLKPGDRLLELGAGAGYLGVLAARVIGAEAVMGVEGVPAMVKVARANLDRNGAGAATLIGGAAVSDGFVGDRVTFNVRKPFWASARAVADGVEGQGRPVEVPALRLGDLIARHHPTVLVVDIEGGEIDLFDRPLPPGVRLMVLEVHPRPYGAAGIKRIFDGLSSAGLTYCPTGSQGDTVVFQRIA